MSDGILLLLGALAVTGLVYCLWKTQVDWQHKGFGWAVVWGLAASLGAFFFAALLFASSTLKDL